MVSGRVEVNLATRPGPHMLPVPRAATTVRRVIGGLRLITIIFTILNEALTLYKWAIIIAAVLSNLVAFGVIDRRNRIVWTVGDFLYRLTEPALRPIRNAMPNFGGIDLSPIVLILLVWVAQMLLGRLYGAIEFGDVRGLIL